MAATAALLTRPCAGDCGATLRAVLNGDGSGVYMRHGIDCDPFCGDRAQCTYERGTPCIPVYCRPCAADWIGRR